MITMVRYYVIPGGRNAGIVVAYGEWPQRVLRHRGWTPERYVCQRVATQSETDWLGGCMRFQAFLYQSVDDLIEDEARVPDRDPVVVKRVAISLGARFQNLDVVR